MADPRRPRRTVLGRLPYPETRFLLGALREETVGGALLLGAAAIAVVWASSPWSDSYETLRNATVGPEALHLHLTLEQWAADGLLAIFFFVAGLELKRELVVGQLRQPSEAALPVAAAVCGMVVPAGVYLLVTRLGGGSTDGWAVPMATDIAFALAVLAVLGSALPTPLRAFLLTLAIVDDLGAIVVIAVVFTDDIDLVKLGLAALAVGGWLFLQHRRVTAPWLLLPLALVTWVLVHESGVHATIAGVALGLATRVRPDPDEHGSPAEHMEHVVRPVSAGVAVPVFALLAAGVAVTPSALRDVFTGAVSLGIVAGLVVGKVVGVVGGAWLTARLTRAELSEDLDWNDIVAVGLLSGIGFTVSLLMGELAFDDSPLLTQVTMAVLVASVLAALCAAPVLRMRQRHYRRVAAQEHADEDGHGIPDVHQHGAEGHTGDSQQ
jgi:NhaA family Na+:H+ antiporter